VGALNEACWYTIFNYTSILIGCVLALCASPLRNLLSRGAWFRFTYPALALLIALQLGAAPHANDAKSKALIDTCYALAVACLLWAVAHEETVVSKVLGAGAITLVGRVSYGIYLIHVVVLNFAKKITQEPPLLFLLTTVLSICLASLLYKFIEGPLIGIGRRLSQRALEQARPSVAMIPDAAVRAP
jgi:peptidoglycan/LPS O-acetylase OafA/YrhL